MIMYSYYGDGGKWHPLDGDSLDIAIESVMGEQVTEVIIRHRDGSSLTYRKFEGDDEDDNDDF